MLRRLFGCAYLCFMLNKRVVDRAVWSEIAFQVILLFTVFIFYAFDVRHNSTGTYVEEYEVAFFMNYAIAAMLINYWLLPKFLYKKRYVPFVVFLLLIIAAVIYVEEEVLEAIYFPTTRAGKFPGVFFNLVAAMPTITILTGFKFGWDAFHQQRKLEQLALTAKESELQYLKSQINPHFLFNNLNNLYAHALEHSEKTPDIILELSGVLRYMLYECKEEYVSIQKEVEQLQNFIQLSALQIEDRGEIHVDVGRMDANFQIAPLILIVFIENAVKHSSSSMHDNIHISIHLHMEEEELVFQCENTYSDESNADDLAHGIGLLNVKKRLKLLYPDKHELKVKAEGDRYTVNLRLKLKPRV